MKLFAGNLGIDEAGAIAATEKRRQRSNEPAVNQVDRHRYRLAFNDARRRVARDGLQADPGPDERACRHGLGWFGRLQQGDRVQQGNQI